MGDRSQPFAGTDFTPMIAPRYGVCLEFAPACFTIGAHLDKVAGGFRKRDLPHMDKSEASRRLRNSYSVMADISTFYRTSDGPHLWGRVIWSVYATKYLA